MIPSWQGTYWQKPSEINQECSAAKSAHVQGILAIVVQHKLMDSAWHVLTPSLHLCQMGIRFFVAGVASK